MSTSTDLRARATEADALISRGRALLRQTIQQAAAEGLSQRQIAALTGRSQPEVSRILREAREASRPWMTARDAADAIRSELARGDEDFALRMLVRAIHDLEHRTAQERTEFLRRPKPTGDQRWDTLLAAAVAWTCTKHGWNTPAWTHRSPLPAPWFAADGDGLLATRTRARTPQVFADLNIWIDEAEFVDA